MVPGSAITVSNTVISLATGASALYIGSSTIPLAVANSAASAALPAITFNSQSINAGSASGYVIGSQTLVPGSAITVSNTPISLASNAAAVVIGSSTIPLAVPGSGIVTALPVITFGSQAITANSASNYVLGSQTLVPGSAITVSNTVVSLATNAAAVAIGSSVIPLAVPNPASSAALPVLTFGSQAITANAASDYVFGSQTLIPGSAITVSSTVISLATGASAVFVGSSKIPLAVPAPTVSAALPVITFSGSTLTANAASEFIFGTQTLKPGGPAITVSNTVISLAPGASAVIIGTSSIPLAVPAPATALPVLAYSGAAITANAASDFVFGSQTLTPGGPAITVSGATLSLASDAEFVVEGTQTVKLTAAVTGGGAAASDKSTGGQIMQPFTGGAGARGGVLGGVGGVSWGACIVGLGVGGLVVWGS